MSAGVKRSATKEEPKTKDRLMKELWAALRPALIKIFQSRDQGLSRMELMRLYQLTNKFCEADDTPPAKYGRVSGVHVPLGRGSFTHEIYKRIEIFLRRTVARLGQAAVQITDDEEILAFYIREAKIYLDGVAQINFICRTINRSWVPVANNGEPDNNGQAFHEIEFLASMIWKRGIFDRWGNQISNCIIGLIRQEREGRKIDYGNFSTVIKSLVHLGYDPQAIKKLKAETASKLSRATTPEEERAIRDWESERLVDSNLSFYRNLFENEFLVATTDYYSQRIEVLHLRENATSVEYVNQVYQWKEEEVRRADKYLQPSTKQRILNILLPISISQKSEFFMAALSEAFSKQTASVEETARKMFHLCFTLGEAGTTELASHLKRQVILQVELNLQKLGERRQNDTYTHGYIKAVHDQMKFFLKLVSDMMQDDLLMVRSVKSGITESLGSNSSVATNKAKSQEILSMGYHYLLQSKKLSQEEINATLQMQDELFALLPNVPAFEVYYRHRLCTRLTDKTSTSAELEEQVIKSLAKHQGNAFVEKLLTILADRKISVDAVREFRTLCENETDHEKKISISLDLTILQHNVIVWTNDRQLIQQPFILPADLVKVQNQFTEFYSKFKPNRHLTWIHSRSKGEIEASSSCFADKRKYVFCGSVYQMAVVLLYVNRDMLTFEEILAATGLDVIVATQVLHQLVNQSAESTVSTPLLRENPPSKKDDPPKAFGKGEKISLNVNFTSKFIRVKLNTLLKLDQQKKDEDEVAKKADNEITFILQASIVRIMKTSKSISDGNLSAQVIDDMVKKKIQISPELIKGQIEILTSKGFMKRCESNPANHIYVA